MKRVMNNRMVAMRMRQGDEEKCSVDTNKLFLAFNVTENEGDVWTSVVSKYADRTVWFTEIMKEATVAARNMLRKH